ncbi:MAG: UMP kinase, partial [Desulfurococcaceae archaeon]
RAWTSSKVVVLGGLQPGQSTNAVAAIVAEMINADLILNATDVDGIYDSNPKKNPQAKLLKEVHIKELEEMLSDKELAGYYELFDRVGLNIVKRSKIPLVFLSVYNTENIRRAINGEEFVGTRIIY